MATQTLTVVLADLVTGKTATKAVTFDIEMIIVKSPGNQTGIVGKPI